MKKLIHHLLLTMITLSFITNSACAEGICYQANKNDFNQTLDTPHDIVFDLSELTKKGWINLSFASFLPIPYADSSYNFYCMQDENKTGSYNCVGDCDGGSMHIRIEDKYLYVDVRSARMANTPDDPIMHVIESKRGKVSKASKTDCPTQHTFKNLGENHLPFVCYNWKGEEESGDKNKLIYHGCTRHNKVCDSIETTQFGKYPNDYESYKAYQRCEDSKPRATSN